ncbi:MAG: hypothetical protein FWE27_04715 [Defluviitaleaceae bacterium]|nr:hypothetical protein [Defluviitaleaceae bacterium]
MKVSQHFYTRERRGLYISSAGYDTVAKSPGLDDSFIKEKIHPYCVYSGGGMNSITVAHFPCGKMFLGQAAFVPVDFTGQRTTFFAHNYILSAEMAGEYLTDIEKLLLTRFENSYDENFKLEELDTLPLTLSLAPAPEVGEGTLIHIVNCVIKSVQSAKKTYVILPKHFSEEFVRALLVEVYNKLPEGIKHLLGFCTNSREPEKRKNIHLVFLENGAYRAGDTRFSDDYIIEIGADYCKSNPQFTKNIVYFILERIAELSPEKFFTEINFWYNRISSVSSFINKAETAWLEKNLEMLQFEKIPSDFIKKGKSGDNSSLYVMLEILKSVSAALKINREISLRYFLGNYSLSPEDYKRTVLNLRRIYKNYLTPPHYENIEFLFREQGTGALNAKEMNNFYRLVFF